MNKTLLSIIAGTLITGCSTGKTWKRACRDVRIEVTNQCDVDSLNWVAEARQQGYDCRIVSYFPNNKLPAHSIVELRDRYGNIMYIEPQTGWKTQLNQQERKDLCYDGN